MRKTGPPGLELLVEVYDPFAGFVAGPNERAGVAAAVSGRIASLAERMGVPAVPAVTVTTLGGSGLGDLPVSLHVAGRVVRYSQTLCAELAAAIDGTPPRPWDGDAAAVWAEGERAGPAPAERVSTLVSWLCAEACARNASVLLGAGQSQAYAATLSRQVPLGLDVDDVWVREILGGVLDLGISIANVARIADLIAQQAHEDSVRLPEALIAALSADAVMVLAPDDVRTHLGRGNLGDSSDLLGVMSEGLFEETGLIFPFFRTVSSDGLPPGTFAVLMNDVVTPPWSLLGPNQLLVNGSPAALGSLSTATPALMPVTGRPAAIAPAVSRSALNEAGYATWDQAEHVILALASLVRARANWLVQEDRLQAQLDALQEQVPVTVLAARAAPDARMLTHLVRSLAADGISVRHLPHLLERLIDFDQMADDEVRLSVLDDPITAVGAFPVPATRTARLEAFVRTGLRHEIARSCSWQTDTIVVYLLHGGVEDLLRSAGDRPDPELHEVVLSAVRAELAYLPPTASAPIVLAADDVRASLRAMLQPSLPQVPVIGYGDLPAEQTIQPIARIQLPAANRQLEA